ncbi:N-acetyl-alpha-D-glucosaminyl L-malate synthase BshA [bacterium]|nr:N-acetyl-alpha-D-glucosaminyl L-malate synthase BshA [candidate division CSSED10-310 bacterium]
MRIAIVCHPTQGGSGIVATELAEALARRGHRVHIVSCDRPFRLAVNSPVRYHRVNIFEYPLFRYPPHDLSLINKLMEVMVEENIDLVHAHYAVPHAIAALIAGMVVPRVKVVATMHGTDITLVGSHPDFFRLCSYTMEQCDGLTTVSAWLRDMTIEKFKLDRIPEVIHNFVDTSRFNPSGRREYAGDEFILMHASNFRPVKRVADVVRVFYRVQRQVPARLILTGTGPELGLVRELCAELGICDRVTFTGSVQQMEDLLRKAHLFLLLSEYESFGLSALEAMACGTPPAVSRAGGLVEVVEDERTGLLCEPDDLERTAARIVTLLTDEARWRAMSVAAAERARREFSIDRLVSRYEELYQRVLGG